MKKRLGTTALTPKAFEKFFFGCKSRFVDGTGLLSEEVTVLSSSYSDPLERLSIQTQ